MTGPKVLAVAAVAVILGGAAVAIGAAMQGDSRTVVTGVLQVTAGLFCLYTAHTLQATAREMARQRGHAASQPGVAAAG